LGGFDATTRWYGRSERVVVKRAAFHKRPTGCCRAGADTLCNFLACSYGLTAAGWSQKAHLHNRPTADMAP
jgi:hypothetical protein